MQPALVLFKVVDVLVCNVKLLLEHGNNYILARSSLVPPVTIVNV